MKRIISLFSAAVISLTSAMAASGSKPDQNFFIYLCIGQSNILSFSNSYT